MTQVRPGHDSVTAATQLNSADFTLLNIPHAVLTWIVANVPKGSKILEFGGGKSTRELSKCFAVTTIDHDLAFIEGIEGKENPILIRAPLTDGYYERAKVADALAERYEVVIVDGPPAWERSKATCRLGFQKWLSRLGNRPVIVVDDVNRPWDYLNLALILVRTGRSPLIFGCKHKLCAVVQRKRIRLADVGWMAGYALRRIARYVVRRVAMLASTWRGEPGTTSQARRGSP